ncbi:MAG: translation initiation factor IF-2 [Chloroflexia bacterium]|nr:translation initiation factor IF-2 [Chloroflexia bacterium]
MIKEVIYMPRKKRPPLRGEEDFAEEIPGPKSSRGRHLQKRAPLQGRASMPLSPRARRAIPIPPILTVKDLGELLAVSAVDVIKTLMKNGVMASINQRIDYETAAIVAADLGFETEEMQPLIDEQEEAIAAGEVVEDDVNAIPRPPVVTIMGHVDHGKTKLLDAIRQTEVAEGEVGGITQHIGAYQIEVKGKKITFLDTPGHEAFTAMRARGAQVTDIVVLVVAADDGVKPQTLEAISHVRAAKAPIIVAINKIDKPGANPNLVRQQLAEAGVMVEEFGGDVPSVEVSAKMKLNIDDLLDIILLVAEMQELKANPDKSAVGAIVEAELDRARGSIATVLIKSGTLRQKDIVVVGETYGKIRAMMTDTGRRVKRAEPSMPVVIMGLDDVPQAGDTLHVVEDEREARDIALTRRRQRELEETRVQRVATIDDLFADIGEGEVKELHLILKADVQGSIGAIEQALQKLNEEDSEVQVTILHKGTGGITESDVMLAVASRGIIIGFNSRPDAASRRAAEREGVEIRFYNIIYELLDDVRQAMQGMLPPQTREVVDGYAEVREVFRLPNKSVAAGLYVTDGKAYRNSQVRVLRNGVVIHTGTVSSLRRFKDDVREVASGYECGLSLDNYNDFEVGDVLEFFHTEQVPAKS